MRVWLRRILMGVSLVVFVFAAATVAAVRISYRLDKNLYDAAAAQYVAPASTTSAQTPLSPTQTSSDDPEAAEDPRLCAPIEVDLASIRAVNPDVVAWIWCEGTVVNYPVLWSDDNDRYLRHTYDGKYSASGSIFVEALDHGDFSDYNTVIYGHNMRSDAMFACLKKWLDPAYYQDHREMWLLTEKGDYRLDLLSAYTTSAYSESYTIFLAPGAELDDYINRALSLSAFKADVQPQPNSRYVLLSTCAYLFDDARYVVHAMMTPADSICGRMPD